MADQKIDSFTVGVGLSSGEFREGIDEIVSAIQGMRNETAEAQEKMGTSFAAMGESVSGLALRFTGLFFAIRGIEDLVGYFKDLSGELANLGFAARNLGTTGVELSRWGEVARLAGGQAEDAVAAVQNLQQGIFGLEYQGQMSENLLMLQRLGVGYLDAAGKMLPFKEIAESTAAALEKQLPGSANRAMRVQWAAEIFGAGGIANAVGAGSEQTRKFYETAHKNQKSITEREIDAQVRTQQHLAELSYQIKGEATAILDKLTPAINSLISEIQKFLIPALHGLSSLIGDWLHPIQTLDKAATAPIDLKHFWRVLPHLGAALGGGAADVHDWWQNILGATQIQAKMPASVLNAMNQAGARGIDMDELIHMYQNAGGTAGDAATNMKLWARVMTQFAKSGEASPYFHPAWTQVVTPQAARPVSSSTAAAQGTHPTAMTGGARVTIGQMIINTQAKDANAMARDANAALERKLLASQSDSGLV